MEVFLIREKAFALLLNFYRTGKIDENRFYEEIASLDPKDRALFKDLVWGSVRKWRYLNWLINRYVRRDISPELRVVLLLGIYQICFESNIPDYAAVDTSVELAKTVVNVKNASKLVNATLRSISREKDRLPLPRSEAVLYSHPEWLYRYWKERCRIPDLSSLLKVDNTIPPLTLRVNRLRCSREELKEELEREGVDVREGRYSPDALIVEKLNKDMRTLKSYQRGLFYVQDEGSQLVSQILEVKRYDRILSVCAAPGGKVTHIAQIQEDEGEIYAVDISKKRMERLKANIERLGIKSIKTFVSRGEELKAETLGFFDIVIVDAPCSGLGTIRKHPDVMWRLNLNDIEKLAEIQLNLLKSAYGLTKGGGKICYTTCTISILENETVIERFLSEDIRSKIIDATEKLKKFGVKNTDSPFAQLYPHIHNTEGLFIAMFEKI